MTTVASRSSQFPVGLAWPGQKLGTSPGQGANLIAQSRKHPRSHIRHPDDDFTGESLILRIWVIFGVVGAMHRSRIGLVATDGIAVRRTDRRPGGHGLYGRL